jgi:hypothetical protein
LHAPQQKLARQESGLPKKVALEASFQPFQFCGSFFAAAFHFFAYFRPKMGFGKNWHVFSPYKAIRKFLPYKKCNFKNASSHAILTFKKI